jgi:hypothetical protein
MLAQLSSLAAAHAPSAARCKVIGIRLRLTLQDPVDGTHDWARETVG